MVLLFCLFSDVSASHWGISFLLVQYGFLRQTSPIRFSPERAINLPGTQSQSLHLALPTFLAARLTPFEEGLVMVLPNQLQ
jgi:hypothetical protein